MTKMPTLTKHTPAPWHVDGNGFVHSINGLRIADPYCDDQDDMPDSEIEANARLIAAAPDLRKACEKVLQDKAAQYADTFDSRMDHDETVIALRAALAKARDEAGSMGRPTQV